MVVEKDIEVGIDAVVYNILDTSHPGGIDGHTLFAVDDMAHHPGSGQTNGLKPLGRHEIDDLLCGGRTLPGFLCTQSAVVGVDVIRTATLERIAEIPAGIHLRCNLDGIRQLGKPDGALKHRQDDHNGYSTLTHEIRTFTFSAPTAFERPRKSMAKIAIPEPAPASDIV